VLGRILKNIDGQTAVMAFSDHGFSTFRRAVHINRWLAEKGFLNLRHKTADDKKGSGPLFQDVDWGSTYAYSLGFGSIYLNLRGREKNGVVNAGSEARSVLDKLAGGLSGLKDPLNGVRVVKRPYISESIYSGKQMDTSPDMIVGFNNGYRASWQTALGGAPANIFDDNLNKWSGDHIMDPSVVPGIILGNFSTTRGTPGLMDVAPTVLTCFGLTAPDIQGKSLI